MNNNRVHINSRLQSFLHPAASSSSSSCPSPSPSPAPLPASTPPLPSSSPPSDYSCRRDHSMLLFKLQAAQRQHMHALKLHDLPPLSPQESSCTISFSDSASSSAQLPWKEPSFRLLQNREPCAQSPKHGFSSFFVNGIESPSSSSCVHTSDQGFPLMHKGNKGTGLAVLPDLSHPSALQAPMRSKMTHKPDEDICTSTDSKRLRCTLEDLEKELLGDDPDIATTSFVSNTQAANSFFSDMTTSSIALDEHEPPALRELVVDERDWTDVIEDFVSAESPSPTTTTNHSTVTSITSNVSSMISSHAAQSHSTPSHPKDLLLACATAMDNEDYATANMNLSSLEQYVSIYGNPMQRVAAHMAEGLAVRMELIKHGYSSKLSQITREASPAEIVQSMRVLYQWCLHFKFGYLVANASIAEACRNEHKIHIIDFNIGQGNQWQTLIGAFAQHLGGPPHICITCVVDPGAPTSLIGVAKRLEEVARMAKVPLEFKHVQVEASQVEPWMLQIKPGEAVVVNLAFHLHRMADESISTSNPRDGLLRKVKALQPKIVTLVEHDANLNTAPFYPRFVETLNYFNAIFESLDAALPRDSRDRVNAEKYCLARDIMNIVACEGVERLQRYEKAGKWRARMIMAGFQSLPVSVHTKKLIKELLARHSSKYQVKKEAGALHIQWLDRSLVATSAWQ